MPGLEFGEPRFGCIELAQVTPQQRVDESRLWAKTALPGQFHRFIDRRVIGNPPQPEDLVKAEPEEVLKGWFLGSVLGFLTDEPIQRQRPTNNAANKFLTQTTVGRG